MNRFNGTNNAKKLDASKKGSWEWTYENTQSPTKCMWWLIKFMDELLNRLINDKEMTVRQAAGESYDIAFGQNHNAIVRKGCKIAIYWAPTRDKFKTLLKIDDIEQL